MFVIDVLEALGFKLGLDWDGELIMQQPESIKPGLVSSWIADHKAEVSKELSARGQREKYVFVGGPYDGRRHGHGWCSAPILIHIKRGEWVAYVVQQDGRAVFYGNASSQRKARRLAYTRTHKAWADKQQRFG
ncbi:hypothetical protein LCGC14_0322880 [marine sediment metagenome]|uniref:Uncharacterized protein n=1 Tax=marine sediment metagenome TaxID=412755 RepID=A0A0F9TP12_9ZZZZ